jgi:hypothetical protein
MGPESTSRRQFSACPGIVGGLTDEQTPKIEPDVTDASKLLRIGTMIRELLNEASRSPLDERGREELQAIYTKTIAELKEVLSPELRGELDDLTVPFDGTAPSESELLIAQAQIVGWLEGLFHGLQASAMAQVAQQQAGTRRLPDGDKSGYL